LKNLVSGQFGKDSAGGDADGGITSAKENEEFSETR